MIDPSLYRLVYYSRNRVPSGELAPAIDHILLASRRNNEPIGITGALLFNAGIFAQVLEGENSAIESTFERIQRDERHGEVEVLEFRPVEERVFPTWSMGFVGTSREGTNLFGPIGMKTGFDEGRLQADQVLELVKQIALEEEGRNR